MQLLHSENATIITLSLVLRAVRVGKGGLFSALPKASRWVFFVLVETGDAERNLMPTMVQCIPTTAAYGRNLSFRRGPREISEPSCELCSVPSL